MTTRILVISEFFLGGGLETQIIGQARALARLGADMLLATGSSNKQVPDGVFAAVLPDLPMSHDVSFQELRSTLDRIGSFIRAEGATAIHAHPFHSSIVGLLVAQEARLPFVLTVHSPLSVDGSLGPLPNLILRATALPAAGRVFCVSKETQLLCHAVAECNTALLPNAVEIPIEATRKPAEGQPWLWAGRLDEAKLPGLLDLIEKMDGLGHELHVYGDGQSAETLKRHLCDCPEKDAFVYLKGWRADLSSVLPEYALVAGMGRVLLEGAALNRPCLLVGYDGVKGILDVAAFERAAFWNLSGRGLATISLESLRQELKSLAQTPSRFCLGPMMAANRSEQAIWKTYLEQIQQLDPLEDPASQGILDALHCRGYTLSPVWPDPDLMEVVVGLLSNTSLSPPRSITTAHQVALLRQRLELGVIRDELTTMRTTISRTQADGDAAVVENSALRQELGVIRDELTTMRGTISRTQADQDAAVAENAALRQELQEVQSKRDKVLAEIAEASSIITQSQYEIRSLSRLLNDSTFELHAVRQSTSWRMSLPIRKLGQIVRPARRLARVYTERLSYLSRRASEKGLRDTFQWIWLRARGLKSEESVSKSDYPAFIEHVATGPIAVIPCAFQFDELANQRPINLAKFLIREGFKVVFVAWQWSKDEALSKSGTIVHPNILQVSLYDFVAMLHLLPKQTPKAGVFFITFPAAIFLQASRSLRAKGFSIAYDIMDDWEEFAKVGQAPWYQREIEECIVLEADNVFGVSAPLVGKFSDQRRDISLSPNGYSIDVLGKSSKNTALRARLGKGITAGYFGHLTDSWFDWENVIAAATHNPDINFEIIGYGAPEHYLRFAQSLKNIKYHGPVQPKELSKYVCFWNVGLIPFKRSTLAAAVDPIKIYEYLFMGLPVVVTGIEHLQTYPSTVVAAGEDDFSRAIREQAKKQRLCWNGTNIDAFLSTSTWDARFSHLIEKIRTTSPAGKLYA